MNLGNASEDIERIGNRGVQKVGDGHAFVLNGKRFTVVTFSSADLAIHVYVRKKAHLDFAQAISLARFTTSALHVKAETPGFVSARSRFRQHCVKLANGSENTGVRGWIGSWRPSDRRLIDLDHFVDEFQTLDGFMCTGIVERAIDVFCQCLIQNLIYQRRLA